MGWPSGLAVFSLLLQLAWLLETGSVAADGYIS